MNVRFQSADSAVAILVARPLLAMLVLCSFAGVARSDDKAPAKSPSAKTEPAKTESAKADPPKVVPAKTASPKAEPARHPAAKTKPTVKVVPIAIAEIKHSGPVDFQAEVLPLLRHNCIACHNSAKAENHLVLETPQSILKGGESGAAVVPKHSGDSLLLQAAAHLDDPTMPPPDNNVKAVALTPDELGLIKLWIDQGATGQVTTATAPLHWQKLPATVRPILAVAVSPDGELAACGRDNEIFVYGVNSGANVARLVDPALAGQSGGGGPGVAHMDLVQSLAFQPSGDLLASGGFREAKLWQRPHNVRLGTLTGAAGSIGFVAISPDGKLAATGENSGTSGTVRLWELPSGKPLQTLTQIRGKPPVAITGLAFSPDGRMLYASDDGRSVFIFRVADAVMIAEIVTTAPIKAMVLAHGGTQVCTGEADNVVRVWAVPAIVLQGANPPSEAAKPLKELKGHTAAVTALATWGDGVQIISGSADGTVRGWNLDNGQQTRQISHGPAVIAIAMRSDGKRFASCGADNIVRLWNGENNQKIAEVHGDFRQQWEVGRLGRVAEIDRSRVEEAKRLVTEAETAAKQESDGIQKAKDRKTAAEKELTEKTTAAKQPLDAKATAEKDFATATDAAKQTADKAAAAKTAADKDAKNKDLAKAAADAKRAADEAQQKLTQAKQRVEETTRNAERPAAERKRAEDSVAAAVRSIELAEQSAKKAADAVPVAKKVVETAEAAKKDADTAVQAATKAATDGKPVRCLTFSPSGLFLAIGGDSHLVQTVSADNGAPADTFEGAADAVLSLAYSPSAGLLAAGADKSAILWNTEPAWPLVRTIGAADDPSKFADRVIALDFSPDGRLLATGGGSPSRTGELKLWNPADGNLVRTVADAHSDTVCSVRFSPDGKLLASGATDRTMKVFDVATGALLKTFEGHTHHVLGVAWRADGQQLATAGADNVVKVWDFASGEQRRTIEGFSKEITAIQFIGGSPKTMTSSGDHFLRIVNTENGSQEKTYGGANDFLFSLGVTPDGTLVAAGGQDGVLRVWNVENAQVVRSFEPVK
jgi:WD40 repeat protein